jgi:hypothetical protein
MESGQHLANAGCGARDTQLDSKIGRILGVGVPNGTPGSAASPPLLIGCGSNHKLAIAKAKASCDHREGRVMGCVHPILRSRLAKTA